MAIFGRRQPFKPIVKTALLPAQPPVGRVVTPRGAFASQAAALFLRRPTFQPVIKRLGAPKPVARLRQFGALVSQAAANAFYRQHPRVTFQTPIVGCANLFIQSKANTTVGATSLTAVFTSNVTAGNLVAVGVFVSGVAAAPTVTDSLGNSYAQAAGAGSSAWVFYARNVTGGACTVTASFGSSLAIALGVTEFTGVGTVDATGTATGTAVSAVTVSAFALAAKCEPLFAIGGTTAGAPGMTGPSGNWNELGTNGAAPKYAFDWQDAATSTADAATWTGGGAGNMAAVVVAFKAGTPASTAPVGRAVQVQTAVQTARQIALLVRGGVKVVSPKVFTIPVSVTEQANATDSCDATVIPTQRNWLPVDVKAPQRTRYQQQLLARSPLVGIPGQADVPAPIDPPLNLSRRAAGSSATGGTPANVTVANVQTAAGDWVWVHIGAKVSNTNPGFVYTVTYNGSAMTALKTITGTSPLDFGNQYGDAVYVIRASSDTKGSVVVVAKDGTSATFAADLAVAVEVVSNQQSTAASADDKISNSSGVATTDADLGSISVSQAAAEFVTASIVARDGIGTAPTGAWQNGFLQGQMCGTSAIVLRTAYLVTTMAGTYDPAVDAIDAAAWFGVAVSMK